jgi:multiple antibiotic resistance protein
MMPAVDAFLLAFPSLFSIINPIGGALIFNEATRALGHAERMRVAGRVGVYAALVMLGALWGGAYVLNFFGVTLGALRIAGGAVVALNAWHLLMSPDRHEDRRRREREAGPDAAEGDPLEMAFFPLTMPYTTGPGTISVAIALGAGRPAAGHGLMAFFLGVSAAAVANAAVVWVAYRFGEGVTGRMGPSARNILSRLTAFLLLCIGVQIFIAGLGQVVAEWRGAAPS